MARILLITCLLWGGMVALYAQGQGEIQGKVLDKDTQEPLIGVSVIIEGSDPIIGSTTDVEGRYRLRPQPGSYNLEASFVGYKNQKKFNIVATSGNTNIQNFQLEEEASSLKEVVVTVERSASAATIENPVSIQRLTSEEIKSNPGGNFDISRVIQSLPGVGGTAGSVGGFRNDIIIRGGAPNENVFFLDGIEIPVINHFQTQGSAGGPTGILNVSFIEDVTLNSTGFNARYDNALASVFEFKQRDGNPDRFSGNVRLSATELAVTTEGPISEKTTFIASARRSYLQLLFEAIDIPIRPNYWDFQYKVTHRFNEKTTLTAIGIGAIDEFSFGVPRESDPNKEFILRAFPVINQWNYTTGFALKRLVNNGYINVALSRNMFDNRLDQFEDGDIGNEEVRNLGIQSQEIENKLRIDVNKRVNKWRYSYGLVGQYVRFNNDVFSVISRERRDSLGNLISPEVQINFDTELDFFRYGGFFQFSRTFFNDRLGISGGLRTDMNSFTEDGNNPLETLSPRASASYTLSEKWNINASAGRYFKLPIYTVLGFQDEEGNFVNRDNRYIQSNHYVTGLEFIPRESSRFTLEGFYKTYANYPVSLLTGISLANLGGDFDVLGNEPTNSSGEGRAYGMEFFFQQKLIKDIFAVFSYTLVRSEFSGLDGELLPSAWDNRHLVSALFGKKFKKGWELGLKFRYAGGAPYTPFDLEASQANYMATGRGVLDFNQLNSLRLDAFSQFDFRIDKKWNFNRTTLNLFLDIQNAFIRANPAFPNYTFERNAENTGFATTDNQALRPDGSNAIPLLLEANDAIVTPSIGLIFEF